MNIVDRLRRHEDYLHVFDSPQGERVLKHICKVGAVFEPTISGDAVQSAVREGRRQLALSILREVHRNDDALYEQLRNEVGGKS